VAPFQSNNVGADAKFAKKNKGVHLKKMPKNHHCFLPSLAVKIGFAKYTVPNKKGHGEVEKYAFREGQCSSLNPGDGQSRIRQWPSG
jgi:hypothetical protein